jgi:hypothetical protein
MWGKEGKEGKVYSLIGGRKKKFKAMPFGNSNSSGDAAGQNIPHIPLFPHRRAVTSQQMEADAPESVAPAMINGRITQCEAFRWSGRTALY